MNKQRLSWVFGHLPGYASANDLLQETSPAVNNGQQVYINICAQFLKRTSHIGALYITVEYFSIIDLRRSLIKKLFDVSFFLFLSNHICHQDLGARTFG